MKIEVLSKDTVSSIYAFVTYINKSNNMTALVLDQMRDGYYVIQIESFDN